MLAIAEPSMFALPLSQAVPLIAAGDHDLADVDAIALQPLREQANELVLRRVGEGEAHGFQAGGERVHLRIDCRRTRRS